MTRFRAEVRPNGVVDSWRVVVVCTHDDGKTVESLLSAGLTRQEGDAKAKRFNDHVEYAESGMPNVLVVRRSA